MPTDPTTNQPLPDSAIQRIVFLTPTVHIYQIPPLTSTQGFSASSWTAPPHPTAKQIFTARLRILETSLPPNTLKADIVLEDPGSGELFAAAPYTSAAVVQQANDSSRFFAVRVVGEGGMKATLGLGFEERGSALDFNIALAEVRKVLGMDASAGKGKEQQQGKAEVKQDFSLKEGQRIHVEVGGLGRRNAGDGEGAGKGDEGAALFSIAPPPPAGRVQDDFSSSAAPASNEGKTAKELGFDDGEFGEFQ